MMYRNLTTDEESLVISQMSCIKAVTDGSRPILLKAGLEHKIDAINTLVNDILYRITKKVSK